MQHPIASILTSVVLLVTGIITLLQGSFFLYVGIVAVVIAVMNGLVAMGRMSGTGGGELDRR
jgi:hypothetical protein